jgi:hypothetical protein
MMDTSRLFYPTTAKFMIFLNSHGIFIKIGHNQSDKSTSKNVKEIEM